MKKIVVTGGCGFIGSHLCELLVQKGFKVVAFDRYNINNDLGWLKKSKFRYGVEITSSIIFCLRGKSSIFRCEYFFPSFVRFSLIFVLRSFIFFGPRRKENNFKNDCYRYT